ncbi:MAG: DUF2298 domain-containing protein [Chloroflexota bacterium]
MARIARMIAGRMYPPRASKVTALALALVWLAAISLRVFGINWDQGQDLHPDELFVAKIVIVDRIRPAWPPDAANLLDPGASLLNARSNDPATGQPREFAYGSLPLYVTDFSAFVLGKISGVNWNTADRVYLAGRFLSALLDSLTVLVAAAIGIRVAGMRAGLLAALLAALAPMMIQLSHFFTTDSWLAFFVAVCIWQCVAAVQDGGARPLVLAGLASGLALATKGSVFTLFAVVALAGALQAARRWQGGDRSGAARALVARGFASAAAALAGFAIFEPYALLSPGIYLQSLRTQADIVRGRFDVPFTRVFVAEGPLYPIEQFVRWGVGPVAGLLCLLGVALLCRMAWRDRTGPAVVLLAWLGVFSLVIGLSEVRFLRYLAPLVPVLAVAGGMAIDAIWGAVSAKAGRWAGAAATAALLGGCALWTVAFMSVYAGEHPRLAASRWMFDRIPPGSSVSAEYWDDALPRNFGPVLSAQAMNFATVPADMYSDRPPPDAAASLYALTQDADYIVLSSNRVERSIRAAPWRYPVQIHFYDLLEDGSLGYRLAGSWERPPKLGPWRIDDQSADESFINYDHPAVRIYQREQAIDRAAFDRLMAPALAEPWSATRHPPGESLLLETPVGQLPVVGDARWSAAFTGGTAGAVAVWVALLVLLQAAALPLAALLFPRFPDHGWGLARLIALLAGGYLVWLGASVGLIRFEAAWCWTSLGLVAAGAWLWSRRGGSAGLALIRPGRAAWGAEAAFWGVFLLFLAFRFLNPDSWHPIWGGEKPMEFAHLNAILRSPGFPPVDPWFGGGYLNYYYYGTYLMAWLIKLTGIPSEIAFNLAQPTVMGLLAAAAFSVGAALARSLSGSERLARLGGALAVVFAVLIGNLKTAALLLSSRVPPRDDFGAWVWEPSRAIADAITEFPFFSGLYADLHAHVIALPITVLAIALGFSIAHGERRHAGDQLAMLALTFGALSATNAWDVPVYAALGIAAVWLGTAAVEPFGRRLALFAATSAGLAAASYVLYLPFHRSFVALFGSLAPVRDPTPLGQWLLHAGGLSAIVAAGLVALQLPRAMPLRLDWVRAGSLLAALAVVWFLAAVGAMIAGFPVMPAGLIGTTIVTVFAGGASWASSIRRGIPAGEAWIDRLPTVVGVLIALMAIVQGRLVLALAAGGMTVAAQGFLFGRTTGRRFVALLAGAAFGVMAGVELVVVADDLLGGPAYRMNTVFKFYNQVWILLALTAAALVAAAPRGQAFLFDSARVRRGWWTLAASLAVVVAAASLLYPVFAVSPRLHQRFGPDLGSGSLNALDWMNTASLPSAGFPDGAIAYRDDRAIIDWFNAEVPGTPMIAEATIGPYRCNGSRISIATGLPTVLGWERHEAQQRYLASLEGRAPDVFRLYDSTDPAEKLAIARRYGVEYIVVGDLERAYPDPGNECAARNPAGIETFGRMTGDSLEIAFTSGDSVVYRVLPEPAAAGDGA